VKNEVQLRAREILHKRVLVLGEVGSGKTRLAARLLEEMMTFVSSEKITVIDMAPERVGEIGGKITDYADLDGYHTRASASLCRAKQKEYRTIA
jgi:adenylate kinase family enzyme